MIVQSIDHIVVATNDLEKCIAFYVGALGMTLERFGEGRIAFRFGEQKINVHPPGYEAGIKAARPTPGSLDLCFLATCPLEDVMARLREHNVPLELPPSLRTGARFRIRSIYVRDPDQNLVEISVPAE